MSKKLSLFLLLTITLLFSLSIIATLIIRTHTYSSRSASVYDQQAVSETTPSASLTPTDGKMNINTATYDDLLQLPGIGEVLAERISNIVRLRVDLHLLKSF